jgi:hypothetical protein
MDYTYTLNKYLDKINAYFSNGGVIDVLSYEYEKGDFKIIADFHHDFERTIILSVMVGYSPFKISSIYFIEDLEKFDSEEFDMSQNCTEEIFNFIKNICQT